MRTCVGLGGIPGTYDISGTYISYSDYYILHSLFEMFLTEFEIDEYFEFCDV